MVCLGLCCVSMLTLSHGLACREISELQRRTREQLEALNARISELDAENRKLREVKYELDTKVGHLSCACMTCAQWVFFPAKCEHTCSHRFTAMNTKHAAVYAERWAE